MPRWRCALIDIDGTLLDYSLAQATAVEEAAAAILRRHDAGVTRALLAFVNSDPVQALEACRPGAPGAGSPLVASAFPAVPDMDPGRFLSAYFRSLSEQGMTIPFAGGMLEALHEAGVVACVVSNGPGPVQRKRLMASGLMGGLDGMVLSCEIGVAKPDPGIFSAALRLVGLPATDAVMIGDSASSDMAGAEASGLDFVYFRPGGDFGAPGRRLAESTTLDDVTSLLVG